MGCCKRGRRPLKARSPSLLKHLCPAQFLESYKSVTLGSMAAAFGVSVDFMDRELVDFIVAGRLPAKIDKVHACTCHLGSLDYCYGQLLAFRISCQQISCYLEEGPQRT